MKCKECNAEINVAALFSLEENRKNKLLFYCPKGCVLKEIYLDPELIKEVIDSVEKKSPA